VFVFHICFIIYKRAGVCPRVIEGVGGFFFLFFVSFWGGGGVSFLV